MAGWSRLGLIAGGGDLPVHVAEACRADGRLGAVVALKGFADPGSFPNATVRGVAKVGGVIEDLRAGGCDAVCFAGIVTRPDFDALKPDWKGMSLLPRVIAAAAKGDDALLRFVVKIFEDEGFSVVGAHEVAESLLAAPGPLGAVAPGQRAKGDIDKAMRIAGEVGRLDIGQGAVVCDGLVLAVEAQEGTDVMLERVAALPQSLRGDAGARRGVIAKRAKPIQERRVDLPVVGVSTIQHAAAAGLAGVAVEAGGAMILGRDAVAHAADEAGLFVVGVKATD